MIDTIYAHQLLKALYIARQHSEIEKLGYPPQSVYSKEYQAGWRVSDTGYSESELANAERCLESLAQTERAHYEAIVIFYRRRIGKKPLAAVKNFALLPPSSDILSTIQQGR